MKRHVQPIPLWSVMVLALALTACASTPLDQRLSIVETSVTQSYQVATQLRQGGFISDLDWPKVLDGLDQANDGLVKAWALYDKDPEAAEKEMNNLEGVVKNLKLLLLPSQQRQIQIDKTGG